MRRDPSFCDLLLGPGLIVAVIATLGGATLLVVAGLAWELLQVRTTVVTEAAPSRVQQLSAAPAQPAQAPAVAQSAPAAELDQHDPSDPADPAPHGAPPTVAEAALEDEDVHADEHSDEHAAAAPVAEATPVPAPAIAAEPAPSPAVTTAQARPQPGPRGAPRAMADLPIIMYHHVGPLPPNPDIFRKDLTVSPAVFEDELQHLADQGIETVSFDDLLEHYSGGPELPKRSVILTFDDGYDDSYEYAFPLLQQYGMTGTFYIVTDFVGRPGYLTWEQIQEMDAAGMQIAAHSATHADLSVVRAAELTRQLVEPKRALEEHLGHPVVHLAYPSGKYNTGTIVAAKAAGYKTAVTVVHGISHPSNAPYEVTRVRARGADTAAALTARMTPASWRR